MSAWLLRAAALPGPHIAAVVPGAAQLQRRALAQLGQVSVAQSGGEARMTARRVKLCRQREPGLAASPFGRRPDEAAQPLLAVGLRRVQTQLGCEGAGSLLAPAWRAVTSR